MRSPGEPSPPPVGPTLRRDVGLTGAVLMGLGSIVGTGVFVSLGLAAGVAGQALVPAILLAACVAAANGLSSAQLAANHPVSGGTYEYGYRYLTPSLGWTAGWMFVCAKSASAATAALGLAGYLLQGWDLPAGRIAGATLAVLALTGVIAWGVRLANQVNAVLVSVTLGSLFLLVAVGAVASPGLDPARDAETAQASDSQASDAEAVVTPLGSSTSDRPLPRWPGQGLLEGTALMFVAFTGYGRIATLGEEVRDPRRTIPRAILVTLLVSAGLYAAVAWVGLRWRSPDALAESARTTAAPLIEIAADLPGGPVWSVLLTVGAVTAMTGVLLNLILGLSRVVLAMGRRGDLPSVVTRIDAHRATPLVAVGVVGAVVAGLTWVGQVGLTWSFSAVTVLIYYAITNLAALQLQESQRLVPRWIAVAGLVSCLGLAFWVETAIWWTALAVLGVGLAWHVGLNWTRQARSSH